MYGIFRGVYFGEYERENYKFGLVQLAVTPASFSVLKRIGFIQYCRHKWHFKIHFLLGAAVSYYYYRLCTIARAYACDRLFRRTKNNCPT